MNTVRLIAAVTLIVLALVAACPVLADDVYHSEHVVLTPAAGFPLRSGFVENIHVNGPAIFAQENYVLNGALPSKTFTVFFFVHPACGYDPAISLPTASFSTNDVGNGQAKAVMTPGMIPPMLRGATIGGHWESLLSDGSVAYATACTAIVLD